MGFALSLCLVLLTLVSVNVFKMPLAYVLLGIGGLSTLWAARQLKRITTPTTLQSAASFDASAKVSKQDASTP